MVGNNPLSEPRLGQDETLATTQENGDGLEMSYRSDADRRLSRMSGVSGVASDRRMSRASGVSGVSRQVSTEAFNGSREELLNELLNEFGTLAGSSVVQRNSVRKNMDEISAVSWEDEFGG